MTAVSNVGPSEFLDTRMTATDCKAVLRRVCFGHLAFTQERHADVRPIRYTYRDDWVYFRADLSLRRVIARAPWLVLSVTEVEDETHVSSVIVRGGCYETKNTGSVVGDAAALQGIMELRDRAPVNRELAPRVRRSSIVFRLHVDELRGVRAFVPCPADARPRGSASVNVDPTPS
jgi:nitroimidazol reductase NimA-like FMN-containing flavoprotein (pyridoxamine 5'-phosphate oxidase superfamily)